MSVKRLAVLVGLGILTYVTNPTREEFDKQYQQRVKERNGTLASYVARGVMFLTDFVECTNCIYFSIATVKPYEGNNNKAQLLAVGMFGKWLFLED